MSTGLSKLILAASLSLFPWSGMSKAICQSSGQSTKPIIRTDNNCESNKAYFDYLATSAGEEGLIIVIARLGVGEHSRKYNQRRLRTIGAYLSNVRNIPSKRIITAEGERMRNGLGRIEVYIGGKAAVVFIVGRNKDLQGIRCE